MKLKLLYLLFFSVIVLSSCVSESTTTAMNNNDILPLAVGNWWRYARQDFYRGGLIERDSITITVAGADSAKGIPYWNVIWNSPSLLDTIQVQKSSDARYYFKHSRDSTYQPLLDLSSAPVALFLHTHSLYVPQHVTFSTLSDTLYQNKKAFRIREHFDLLRKDSSIALYMDFDHALVPGIGEVSARFISDISQCLVCSLQNEFWVYELTSYNVK